MSGFAAMFERDGGPVDRSLLDGLASFLSFRGPDARDTWASGAVGLAHTLLRTNRSFANERQPVGVDGQFWIVADARLDARDELIARLQQAGHFGGTATRDAELILHAYVAWREGCVAYLRGDFSFAIWDGRARQFFCARDHFGVKPLYYTQAPDFFACSNTLDCVRQMPGVSDELNDDAVADFLLFGLNCNTSTTFFGDIRRLPAAHFLVVTADDVRVERYWSAPIDGRIRYRRDEEYAEHFAEVLRRAVADRVDVDRAAVFLSGGLDSGAVAVSAREVAPAMELRAFTATCETLFEDRERHFARQTADMLGIPFQLVPFGDEQPFADWEEISIPEPVANPLEASSRDHLKAAAEYARVALNGEGADNLMAFEFRPYAADLARRGEWLTLASASGGFFWKKRARLHRLGLRAIRKLRGGDPAVVPDWIDSDFAKRMRLRDRLDSRRASVCRTHPILPVAHASLEIPDWASFLEALDPGFTGQMIEQRFPFLDLRVVEYLLAIPPYPHFLGKAITRRAMRGKLPAAILSRPKTPLRGDPGLAVLRKSGESYLQDIRWDGEIGRYVTSATKQIGEKPDLHSGISCMHAVCLNFWLHSSWRLRYKFVVEVS